MGVLKLCFIWLLPLTVCHDAEETIVKTVREEPDVTRICDDEIHNAIVLIVCKIRTPRKTGGECHLLYRHGENSARECDSRFTLMKDNTTVFLHLVSLTPDDSGNYTCECTNTEGTYILHISVTVEDTKDAHGGKSISIYVTGAGVFITGVILGFTCWMKKHGGCLRSETSGLSVPERPNCLAEDDPDGPYTNLHQPANDFYQTISSVHQQQDARTESARSRAWQPG